MKLGLVGYGAIAEAHMSALREVDEVIPWVLIGRRANPAEQFAQKWGFHHHTLDYASALTDRELDAVIITSPNALHAEQAIQALRAGKHVLVEIPLAMSFAEAERVAAESRKANRRLMVAHTFRYFPGLQEVRRRVSSSAMRLQHMVALFGLPRRTNTTNTGEPRSWTDHLLWHFGAHMVDLALWITGHTEAARISCHYGRPHPPQGILDLSLSLTLGGGEVISIAESFNLTPLHLLIHFIGEEQTLRFDRGAVYDSDGKQLVAPHSLTDVREQDREFIASIREGRDPGITGEHVLPCMRVLQQAERDAERPFS